ncbi:MAG: NPCBM/NEW2 domain-containing protein [Planctomycetes bacterium]|nr:NPCBM/NEW2 domain-containing protein [Planctomycetota bacterium]
MRSLRSLSIAAAALLLAPAGARLDAAEETVPLSSLDLSNMSCGWGRPQIDRSVTEKPMAIAGRAFARGVGTHAPSVLRVDLDGKAKRFTALVGVDDATGGRGTIRFRVLGDGKKLLATPVIKGGEPARSIDVALDGVRHLVLLADAGGDNRDFDHVDLAEAVFIVAGARPVAVDAPKEEAVLRTPKPGPEPRINGPRVYGCRPGRPFIYRIPATGERPMTFAADALPSTLRLDTATGIISGSAPKERGEHRVTLRAKNGRGSASRPFTIVAGDTLALTPPMGWNHWYTFYDRVSDALFRSAADAMVESGMADFGYAYVNMDDCWMVKPGSPDPKLGGEPLDADGAIRGNGNFPDLAGLCAYIHAKGLKAGLYTSPGPRTCAGYQGSYGHEELDARQFAAWGFDFLKYDWCSYGRLAGGNTIEHLQRPYRKMGAILRGLDRDIVLNLCQYGMGEVWKWGAEVGGQCWRTTGDLGLEADSDLPGFYAIGLSNARHHEYARPGAWNDPDYILIGYVGDARRSDAPAKPTPLTPNEQYSYMSMWCLMAAPLVYSGDIRRLDEFTLNILCNAEVIDIDQDPLGRQATIVRRTEDSLVMAKPLEDGSVAVGLFGLGELEGEVAVAWADLGLEGPRRVRDLWRQRDLGEFETGYAARIPRHGVMLIRVR